MVMMTHCKGATTRTRGLESPGSRGENGCLYFLLGVVRIFSKFGAGCIFFQYLVTNLFSMVQARAVCIFW